MLRTLGFFRDERIAMLKAKLESREAEIILK
jgi:hypothetical protein